MLDQEPVERRGGPDSGGLAAPAALVGAAPSIAAVARSALKAGKGTWATQVTKARTAKLV